MECVYSTLKCVTMQWVDESSPHKLLACIYTLEQDIRSTPWEGIVQLFYPMPCTYMYSPCTCIPVVVLNKVLYGEAMPGGFKPLLFNPQAYKGKGADAIPW